MSCLDSLCLAVHGVKGVMPFTDRAVKEDRLHIVCRVCKQDIHSLWNEKPLNCKIAISNWEVPGGGGGGATLPSTYTDV